MARPLRYSTDIYATEYGPVLPTTTVLPQDNITRPVFLEQDDHGGADNVRLVIGDTDEGNDSDTAICGTREEIRAFLTAALSVLDHPTDPDRAWKLYLDGKAAFWAED